MLKRFIKPLFFGRAFYWGFAVLILLFVLSYNWLYLYSIAKYAVLFFAALVLLDYLILFAKTNGINAERNMADRFSNGDENTVSIHLKSSYSFPVFLKVIEELPVQFQRRDFLMKASLGIGKETILHYKLRPVERGEYTFHYTNVFVKSVLGLIIRRYQESGESTVIKVMPSFFALRQFELRAMSNNLADAGSRKIRKIGHSLEFEQIKEYVTGDDIRSLNWKATARKGGQLMVNNYSDERSQQIYCVIDKGRVMKMPFEGVSLLDYAINATLVLTRVALLRQDKAGMVTFADTLGQFVPADRKAGQMNLVLETLYNQQTQFLESDYEKLYALVRTRITQRSLIVLFSNFESVGGLQRQLPYIRSIARNHLVLVVFFENTELKQLTGQKVTDIESLYMRTIAERIGHEKRLIVKELQQHGISTILTTPQNLTVETVNKYLELKARQAI
ncbi:DUF58 domain-containing protein [Pseudobacter ginsenosidimutans]|uniref:Uncharacterized protein (DUF58 family) n=1 Tax=Pseudobacter ginsenosidimutans TaxID=661488 RepID=A0A4Q7N176_9BACT|nr:DUF58 domain-containing protein [Pseudobacter ginsenosidimutans]QEC43008.1 DUF58 domain-containing protein [Pseudobacter ginsenosidimutans]RZS74359.1 uncharacterized protein (DUF58 family) [Pseudobacter ginsenosidimutans]